MKVFGILDRAVKGLGEVIPPGRRYEGETCDGFVMLRGPKSGRLYPVPGTWFRTLCLSEDGVPKVPSGPVHEAATATASETAPEVPVKRKPGRPPGSKNRPKEAGEAA